MPTSVEVQSTLTENNWLISYLSLHSGITVVYNSIITLTAKISLHHRILQSEPGLTPDGPDSELDNLLWHFISFFRLT